MAGFLDDYGAGDERRARLIKNIAVSLAVLAVLSGVLYFLFRNYRQEQQAKRFFQQLEAHNYQAAYEMWVGSDSDRRGYPMSAFMDDWGPKAMDLKSFTIMDAEGCGNNVIIDADLVPAGDKRLWVNRDTLLLSFGPYQVCQHQNRIYNFYRNVKYQLHGKTYQ
jgi:hypothetical protein